MPAEEKDVSKESTPVEEKDADKNGKPAEEKNGGKESAPVEEKGGGTEGAPAEEKDNGKKSKPVVLSVSIGTKMLLEPVGVSDRFKTDFVGMERGRYLIVRLPRIPGVREQLYDEKPVKVRYIHEGNVYGFESLVVSILATPFRLLFLTYPKNIETLNLRQCPRVDCYLPVAVGLSDNRYDGLVLNLSCGGCQVVVETKDKVALPKIAVDEDITLEFKMFASDKNMNLAGKVKNINVNEPRMYLGVKYNELSEDIKNELENYISSVTNYLEE